MVDEAIPPIPVPVPAVIPRPPSRGINWMALFDRACAVTGTVSLIIRASIYLGSEES